MTRVEIEALYAWQPGEREEAERQMAERQARIDAEAIAAAMRAEQPAEPVITKAAPQPQGRNSSWASWQRWAQSVERRLAKQRKQRDAILGGVADVIREQRQAREQADAEQRRELATVQTELEALKIEVAELRGRLAERSDAAAPDRKTLRSVG